MKQYTNTESLIPLNPDYETRIFNSRNISPDCDYIAYLMYEENKHIMALAEGGVYQEAALLFLQLAKSMCCHFVMDEHYNFFDDIYSPDYALDDLIEYFQKLIDTGTLPKDVTEFLLEGWKEIESSVCYTNYGIPQNGVKS